MHLICRNKVTDFEKWKAVFDSHAEAHAEFGLKLQNLWRGVDNPNEVFMLFEVENEEKARAFVTSPEVPDAQSQAGVVELPDIYFVE